MALIKLAGSDISWDVRGRRHDPARRAPQRARLPLRMQCRLVRQLPLRPGRGRGRASARRPAGPERTRPAARPPPRLPGAAEHGLRRQGAVDAALCQPLPAAAPAGDADRDAATSPTTSASSASGSKSPTRFLPGQYALLSVPGVDGSRAYSMCNTGEDGAEWHFQIKRVPGGAATDRLFETGVGDADRDRRPLRHGLSARRRAARHRVHRRRIGPVADDLDRARGCECTGARATGGSISSMAAARRATSAGTTSWSNCRASADRIRYHAAISDAAADGDGWNGYRGFVHDVADEMFGDPARGLRDLLRRSARHGRSGAEDAGRTGRAAGPGPFRSVLLEGTG